MQHLEKALEEWWAESKQAASMTKVSMTEQVFALSYKIEHV